MSLTALQVKNAKPGRHVDGNGLALVVRPSGSRSWVLRVQVAKVRRDYGLGSTLSLNEAREKAAEWRKLAKAGIDPARARRSVAVHIPSFRDAAILYHAQVSKSWRNGKHNAQWLSTLENYAFPLIGSKPVNEIEAPDLQSVLIPIWLTKGETARRVKQRVAVVLDYCKGKGWRETEAPVRALDQLMKGLKQPQGSNFGALPYSKLPPFMTTLRTQETSVGRKALEFLILTVARSGEVRGMTWEEVDLEAAEWRLPASRMKAGKPHIVPLVPAAVAILREMHKLAAGRKGEPVFPGLKRKPLSDATLSKALRVAGGGDYTVHGFRSTFTDWAADTGFSDAWAKAAKAHKNPDKTEAAYKRTTYFDARREKLMPGWADYCLGQDTNVVRLVAS